MAGIGIKANISLNKKKLSDDIKDIQDKIAEQGSVFKLSIDSGTIAQLGELKTQLKEIVDLAGKGIKISIDTKVIQEAKKEVEKTKEAIDKIGSGSGDGGDVEVSKGRFGTFEESAKKALSKVNGYFQDTEKVIRTTLKFANDFGHAYTEVWDLNNESGKFEVGSMKDVEDFGKIQKEVEGIGKSFDAVKQKYNQTVGAWSDKEVDLGITNSFKEVSTQIDLMKSKGNLVDADDIARMRELVATSELLTKTKIEQQDLAQKIDVAQEKIKNSMSQFKNTNAGRFVSEEDLQRIRQMSVELANVKNPAELKAGLININKELDMVKAKARDSANGFKDLGNESHGLKKLSDGLAKIGLYFSAWRLTSEVFQELKRGIGIVAELDNQIVQVGIDMNITAQESKSLVQQAQRIASETGTAIDAVIKVAGVYSNANETMESVMAKVKPSAILAGVSGADASMVTDMFQGVIAQYKIAKDDIEAISYDISDSIIAVSKNLSKNFDDSVKDISDGLLDAGSVMEMMGYTYKETMALIGATIEVTRQSGSEMGGALRMIGARIGGAKNVGEDVAPEEISNAAKAYNQLGIEIVDANGNFKPMKDTLAELKFKWDDLSDAEKSNIAEMSAGNRRRNTFIAMMESMEKSTSLTEIAINSQGETLLTNEKYMESSAAKIQNFTNAIDTLWQNTLSSDKLKNIVDFGTGVVNLVDKIGMIPLIVGTASAAMLVHKNIIVLSKKANEELLVSEVATATGLKTVKVAGVSTGIAFDALKLKTALLQATLTLGLSLAITFVVSKLTELYFAAKNSGEALSAHSQQLADEGKAATDDANKLKSLVQEQTKLEASVRNDTITTEEATKAKERLSEIYKEIAGIAPELINAWDEDNQGLATNADSTWAVIKAKEELVKINAKLWLQENSISDTFADTSKANIDAKKKELEEFQRLEQQGIKKTTKSTKFTSITGTVSYYDKDYDVIKEVKRLSEEVLNDEKFRYEVMLKEVEAAGNSSDAIAIQRKYIDDVIKAEDELKTKTEEVVASTKRVSFTLKEINELLGESVDKSQKYGDILDEMGDKDFKAMSSDSSEWILENAPQLIQYLDDEKKLKEEIIKLQDEERVTGQQLFADKMLHLSKEQMLAYETMNEKTKYDAEFYNTTVKNNSSLITAFYNMYGIDLKNYNSLAEAKNAVDIKYGKTAKANYNQIFDGIYRKYGNMVQRMTGNDRMDNLTEDEKRMINFTNYQAGKTAGATLDAISFTPVGYGGITMPKSSSSSSGSSKDNQEYESDVADMNWYTHLVEDYQKKLEKLAASISKTKTEIENLKEVGSVKSLEQAIQKEKELYKLNEQKVALLKEERQALASNMNTLQNTINSKYGKIDMSTRTDESLDYYLDSLFPKIVSSNQAVVDARNAQREQFTQMYTDYMMLSNEYMSVDAEYIAMQSELMAITKERYDLEFALMDKQLEKRKKAIGEYANQYALLDDSSSFNEKESLMAQQLDGLKGYRIELEGIVSGLTRQLTLLDSNSQEWGIVNTQLETYKDALQGTNVEILGMQQSLKSLRMEEYNASVSVIDKIVGTLREEYETAKKAELKALKDTIDAEMNIKNAELKVLQDRLDALNDTTADKEAELRGLRQEQAMWEKDDSIAAKAKLAELELLIKDKEKELLKDSIQSEMDGIQTEIDDLDKFNEEQTTNVEDKYAKLLEEQALYQQATLLFQSQSQDEILAILLTYDEKYKGMGSVLGKAFAEGLMEEIANGIDGFGSLSDGLTGKDSIPWMENLSGSYNYTKSTAPVTSDVYANSSLNYKKLIDALGGVDGLATSGILGSLGVSSKGLSTTTIGNATISMPVTFYTNGQVDIDRSIGSLEKTLKDALSGSGVALSLSVNR